MESENGKKSKNVKREKHAGSGGSHRSVERRLRHRERKHYTEDCMNDEEIEGKRMFSVEEKLLSNRFNANFVQQMNGDDLCIAYFQEHGFLYPIVVKEKSGLGLRLPNANFTVHDVRQCVGSRRILDVMDVTTQRDIEMTMKEWVKYYENPQRDKLLNVISLEFSHTKLDNYIESPRLVREIDWVNRVWPQHLKDSQLEATNSIEDMRYPKVQKYCLMSVKGCYTDFHIDFGGTSVWYHILRGRKVFWLIPPTEMNVQLYEQWVLSGKQSDIFFGDTVDECGRIELEEGWTFFIPTGWIHAVYTPTDSLVFGGNFLHSFGIEKQLRIAQVEDATRVPPKFRYPFYTEMLWYVLDRYVHCLLGRSHVDWSGRDVDAIGDPSMTGVEARLENGVLTSDVDGTSRPLTSVSGEETVWTDRNHIGLSDLCRSPNGSDSGGPPLVPMASPQDSVASNNELEGKENRWAAYGDWHVRRAGTDTEDPDGRFTLRRSLSPSTAPVEPPDREHVHLTRREISGLKAIAIWLSHLSSSKRSVPDLIKDPVALLNDVKVLLGRHKNDDPLLAITGKPVLNWNNLPQISPPLIALEPKAVKPTVSVESVAPLVLKTSAMTVTSKSSGSSRRRRTRCKKCEACVRADCGDCHFCKDMKKFGGPGRMKQSCMARQCTAQPILPHTACCMVCGKDGWRKNADDEDDDDDEDDQFSSLMECSICWEIVHPECLDKPVTTSTSEGGEELPNSWECPKCCRNTKGGPAPKLRKVKPGQKPGPRGGTRHGRDTQHETTRTAKAANLAKRREFSVYTAGSWKRKKSESSDDDEESESSSQSDGDVSASVSNKLKLSKERPSKAAGGKRRASGGHIRSCVQQQQLPLLQTQLLRSPLAGEPSPRTFSLPLLMQAVDLSRPSAQPTLASDENRVETYDEDKMQKLKLRMLGLTSPLPVPPPVLPSVPPPPPPLPPPPNVVPPEVENKNGILDASSKTEASNRGGIESGIRPLVLTSPEESASHSSMAISPKSGSIPPNNRERLKLKKPMYVVRPAPILDSKLRNPTPIRSDFAMDKTIMLAVFRHLDPSNLVRCMLVCRAWNAWCLDRNLWSTIDLTEKKISTAHLAGIVRRQPAHLGLESTNISKKLLGWLMVRLPQLRHLGLARCSWASVSGLVTCNCPTLQALDVSSVDGLNDARVRELLAPPLDSRPGLLESKSRLRNLSELRLSGCDVSDVSLRYLSQYLPRLARLDLNGCEKVSDAGVALLSGAGSPVRESLVRLDASGCARLTDNSLEYLKRCPLIFRVDLRECPAVSVIACRRFIAQAQKPLMMAEAKLIEKQKIGFTHST